MHSTETLPSHRNFADLVLRHELSLAGHLALVVCTVLDGAPGVQESVTFGAFTARVRRLALQLERAGFQPGDRIAVAMPVSVDLYALVLAMMMMGAIPVLLNPGAGLGNTYHSLKTVRLHGIISAKPIGKWRYLLPVLWRVRRLLTFEALTALKIPKNAEAEIIRSADPPPGQPALITFTSGSSGRPKGVNRTHDILISQYEAIRSHFPPLAGQIDLPAFPVLTLYNLCCGVTTIMPLVSLKAVSEVDPGLILDQITRFGVTTMSGAPAYLEKITGYCIDKGITVPQVKGLAVGGAPVSTGLAQAIRRVFPEAEAHILYGSSEAEPIASVTIPEYLAAESLRHQGYLVGRKAESVQLKLLPLHATNAVPTEPPSSFAIGEIIVAGKHVCRAYYRNPEADRKHKLRDADGTLWHRTGDVGFLDDDGRLWLTGRLENLFTVNGRAVFPFQVERVVDAIEGVGRSAVTGSGKGMIIFLEPPSISQALEAAIRHAVAQQFGLEQFRLQPIDKLPVDQRHQSKIDYPALQRPGRK